MSYDALSCFPKADCSSGFLVLNEKRESLPLLADAVLVLESTLLYPALLVITVLSELYLAVNWSIHKSKHWSLKKKITEIEICSDQSIETLKNQRLQKLAKRKVKQHAEVLKTLRSVQDLYPNLAQRSLIEKIKENYQNAVERADLEDYSLPSVCARTRCEEKLKVVLAYERTVDEIECYENKSTSEIRKIFSEKYKFLQLRHQLNQHIDCHYLRNLLIIQIPIIGLIYLSHSDYTTKKSLEKTNLVIQYNSLIEKYKWFKPY